MAMITDEMRRVIDKVRTPAVATADRDGKPNVVPIAFTRVVSYSEILLADNFMNKTRANIDENPLVAVSVWAPEEPVGYQFKGKARIETGGTIFEECRRWVQSRRPNIEPRAAIVVEIEEIYTIGSGDNAGKRIA